MAKSESGTPPWAKGFEPAVIDVKFGPEKEQAASFAEQYKAHMAKLGAKGGRVSGAKQMTNLSDKQRRDIAMKAAAARWGKKS